MPSRRPEAVIDAAGIERALEHVEAVVRTQGSLPRSRLAKLGVPKRAQPDAVSRLARKGLEATPRLLRVPLGEQLVARLRDGAMLPMRSLRNAVSGATAREVATAALDVVRSGAALLVVRGKELALTAPRADVLGERDLAVLERTLSELTKTLKSARKHHAVLLNADVREVLEPFTSAIRAPIGVAQVLAQVRAQRLASGLVFVPTLVRALGGPAARDAIHQALREAAARGLVELRPESGLGRLSDEDLSLCLPGPRGSRLSWARPIEEPR